MNEEQAWTAIVGAIRMYRGTLEEHQALQEAARVIDGILRVHRAAQNGSGTVEDLEELKA